MAGRDDFEAWSRGEKVRPRAGWVEKLFWVGALLFVALVPVMCAVDTGILYWPRN